MIQANCRARFTAADFDFVVRTLARSPNDHVSLVDLLGDAETRDTRSRSSAPGRGDPFQRRPASHFVSFLFLCARAACLAATPESAIANFAITSARFWKLFRAPSACARRTGRGRRIAAQYLSDMLIALTRATPEKRFLLRAHVGNYSLFISGIFHENTQRRSLRGAPDLEFYEKIGRTQLSTRRFPCDRAALRT